MSDHVVAVYGSLRRGFHNHPVLGDSEYFGESATEARYTMIDLGYFPAVIDSGGTAIHVEIYRVSEAVLADMDLLEGVPTFYRRETVSVRDFGEAIMYVLSEAYLESLESGSRRIIPSGLWA